MPLLCPSVYILLLLPLVARSCNSTKSPQDIAGHYRDTIQVELRNTIENIENLLIYKTCLDHKPKVTCVTRNTSFVTTLLTITCKMKNLSINLTEHLIDSVQVSVACPCSEQLTNHPERRGTISRTERHQDKKHIKKKLCRTKSLLLALEECFQLLNSITSKGADRGN